MQKPRKKIIQNQNWHIEQKNLNHKNRFFVLLQALFIIIIWIIFTFPTLEQKITGNIVRLCQEYDIGKSLLLPFLQVVCA